MSTNLKNDDSIFSNKNIYINDFTNEQPITNLSESNLTQLMKKLDNISDYLNILMNEINEIKKTAKINTNTYQTSQPNIYKSFPVYKNKKNPYYQQTNSQYSLDPDMVFK